MLGAGEHRCGPLVFASIEVPRRRSRFFPFYQHIFALGEGDYGPDTNDASIRPAAVLTMWPNRGYTFLDPNLFIQYEPETECGMTPGARGRPRPEQARECLDTPGRGGVRRHSAGLRLESGGGFPLLLPLKVPVHRVSDDL